MTGNSVNLVQFSQENLYFPLPLNSLIENILQLKNLLQPTGTREENVVAFKILSSVRSRYGVRPRTGFIFASESVRINFFLDVKQLKEKAKLGSASMPGIDTKDIIFVDVAVVPASAVVEYLSKGAPGEGKDRNVYADEASDFWRIRGQVQDDERDARRYQLRSLYYESRDGVPEGLVMRRGNSKTSSNSEISQSRRANHRKSDDITALPLELTPRPSTERVDGSIKSPPLALPQFLLSSLTSLISTRAKVTVTPQSAASFNNSPEKLGSAAALFTGPMMTMEATSPHGSNGNFVEANTVDKNTFWKEVAFLKIPIPAVGALLLLALLCALFERGTTLSMWLIGK